MDDWRCYSSIGTGFWISACHRCRFCCCVPYVAGMFIVYVFICVYVHCLKFEFEIEICFFSLFFLFKGRGHIWRYFCTLSRACLNYIFWREIENTFFNTKHKLIIITYSTVSPLQSLFILPHF